MLHVVTVGKVENTGLTTLIRTDLKHLYGNKVGYYKQGREFDS